MVLLRRRAFGESFVGRLWSHANADRYRQSSRPWTAQFHSTRSIWLSSLKTLRHSEVLSGILQPLLLTTTASLGVALFDSVADGVPGKSASKALFQMHSLLGGALSLLLVFRTNSAYNRFWEARRIWENLLNRCRELARYAYCFRDQLQPCRVDRLAQLLTAFPVMLRRHLCLLAPLAPLPAPLCDAMRSSSSRPLYLCKRLAAEISGVSDASDGTFTSRERLMGLSLVNQLGSYVGACERLLQTPVPLNYARHTSRFLTLWCLTLPVSLVGSMGLLVVPVTAFVTWCLFGIQEIGLFIEHCALDNGDIFMDQLSDQERATWRHDGVGGGSCQGGAGSDSDFAARYVPPAPMPF
ncbi:hypothetical protein EMIHUDRAFT_215245 [Emiliania huxleyi CCMP1516]|uniref:Uncharacterized protein n=2 Tax=Emiliania huxleyi TaxID=2903 RepID=A0A0D3II49_EMIH1|nr:hypothetical protein EMIHUDRAFT_215245 [Emiliania huxleyi CCMP1516]EOD10934.1 hypothetical protein EMIHUDRAFT_215245 [Emiliania huxleyi CCMP1516]|eukprot:XP_005763363.1 hypothetical protein EMIHUDRAFT_215245 [Emiliania huxleyi CCMP1516]